MGIEVYKCVRGLNPTYMNKLFEISDPDYSLRDPFRLKQPNMTHKPLAIDPLVITVQNYGTFYLWK